MIVVILLFPRAYDGVDVFMCYSTLNKQLVLKMEVL